MGETQQTSVVDTSKMEEFDEPPKAAQYEPMTDDPLADPFASVSNSAALEPAVPMEPSSSAVSNVDPFGSMGDPDDPFGATLTSPPVMSSPISEDPFGSVADSATTAPTVVESSNAATSSDDPFGSVLETVSSLPAPSDDPFGSVTESVPSSDVDPFGSMGGDADADPFGAAASGDDGFDAAFPSSFDAPTDGSGSGFDAEFPAFGDSSADPFASATDGVVNNSSNNNIDGNNDSFGAFPAF